MNTDNKRLNTKTEGIFYSHREAETIAVIAAVVRSQPPVVCVNQLTVREGSDVTIVPPHQHASMYT